MGHWIEEHAPAVWTLESALLGFVQMNTAHNGARLGQAVTLGPGVRLDVRFL